MPPVDKRHAVSGGRPGPIGLSTAREVRHAARRQARIEATGKGGRRLPHLYKVWITAWFVSRQGSAEETSPLSSSGRTRTGFWQRHATAPPTEDVAARPTFHHLSGTYADTGLMTPDHLPRVAAPPEDGESTHRSGTRGATQVTMRDFWWRCAALAVPTTAYAIVTRPGAEPSDRTAALIGLPAVFALFWVIYPVASRFLQIEPTRMTAWEYAFGGVAVAALSVVRNGSLPVVLGVVAALCASAALAYVSATILQRQRDGDTSTTFFS